MNSKKKKMKNCEFLTFQDIRLIVVNNAASITKGNMSQ